MLGSYLKILSCIPLLSAANKRIDFELGSFVKLLGIYYLLFRQVIKDQYIIIGHQMYL